MRPDHKMLAIENRQISIRMEQLTDRLMRQTGLSTAQAHLLMQILRQGEEGASLTAIHRQCGYSMAALSNILQRLRRAGYVRVETSDEDNRCKRLYGTEKALEARAAMDEVLKRGGEIAYRGFSEEELRQLDALQKRLLKNLAAPAGRGE